MLKSTDVNKTGGSILNANYPPKWVNFACLFTGYWSVVIGLACYTLFNLTGSAPVSVAILAASLGFLFALHFKCGLITPLLALALIPWLPGHPLVVTAGLIPDAGFYGLGILVVSIAVIEKAKTRWLKIPAVLILVSVATVAQVQHVPIRGTFTARPLVPVKALSDISKWRQTLERIPKNAVVVLGENNFNTSDRDISNLFCAAAAQKNTVIYTGLFNAVTQTPEVWAYNPTCLPQRQYAAMLRAPVDLAALELARRTSTGPYNWLICFEAFSLWRWGIEITNEIDVLFVISQDRWAYPFNIPLLRRKIVSGFAAAFGFDYALAETGRSMVIGE